MESASARTRARRQYTRTCTACVAFAPGFSAPSSRGNRRVQIGRSKTGLRCCRACALQSDAAEILADGFARPISVPVELADRILHQIDQSWSRAAKAPARGAPWWLTANGA